MSECYRFQLVICACYLSPSLCPEHLLTNESEVYELLDVTKSAGPDEIIQDLQCSKTLLIASHQQ